MTQIIDSNKFGKVTIEDIVRFEKANNILLPEDYKAFLLKHNGGRPFLNIEPTAKSNVQWILGMVEEPSFASLFQQHDMFCKRIPSWYFPIANDSGGNLYLMSLFAENYGLIAFWRHEQETTGDADQYFENMSIVANSFSEFLDQLVANVETT